MIIGIMGAMPDEVDQLCAKLEQVTKETYAGVEYHQGMLNGRRSLCAAPVWARQTPLPPCRF